MADNTNIITLGSVAFTDKGDWQSGYSFVDADSGETVKGYDENDIVHTSKGVYASLKDGNTANPDEDSAGWRVWLDLKPSVSAQTAETARQTAETTRAKAEEARASAEKARADAENARAQNETSRGSHETEREQAEKERKAGEKSRAADFQTLYDGIQAKSAELDRLIAAIQQQGSIAPMASVPARICTVEEVTVLAGATGSVAPMDVQPSTANRSMVYQIYSGNALVDADGTVKTSEAGDIIVKVIPTLASGAARVVTIHAKEAEALTDGDGSTITDENDGEIGC